MTVWTVIHLRFRALRDTLFLDGADVMGFSVVIPGKNLLRQFPSQFRRMKG